MFPDSSQVRSVALAEAQDRAVWDYAAANGFIVVSQDSDFAEMAALFGPPPKVVWLRGGNRPTAATEAALRRSVDAIAALNLEADTACLEIY